MKTAEGEDMERINQRENDGECTGENRCLGRPGTVGVGEPCGQTEGES